MDLSNLTEQEKDKILQIYQDIDDLTQKEKDDELSELLNNSYPLIDFYIASHLDKKISKDDTYTLDNIDNLTDDKKIEFGEIFLLNPDEENFIERLERILRYLNLIVEPFDLGVYDIILSNANYKTIKNLCSTKTLLRKHCSNNYFWEELLIYKYGDTNLRKPLHDNMISAFKRTYKDNYLEKVEDHMSPLNAEMTYIAKEIFKKYDLSELMKEDIIGILEGNVTVKITSNIGIKDTKAIKEALKFNNSFETLNFSYNNIRAEEAQIIRKALKVNTSLKNLDIHHSHIEDDGAKVFAEVLKDTNSLQTLNISNNDIGDDGIIAIAESLKVNKSLQTLYKFGNNIGERGNIALEEASKINKDVKIY